MFQNPGVDNNVKTVKPFFYRFLMTTYNSNLLLPKHSHFTEWKKIQSHVCLIFIFSIFILNSSKKKHKIWPTHIVKMMNIVQDTNDVLITAPTSMFSLANLCDKLSSVVIQREWDRERVRQRECCAWVRSPVTPLACISPSSANKLSGKKKKRHNFPRRGLCL